MLDAMLSPVIPDYVSLLQEILALQAEFFVGGVLISFLAWAVGIAVYTAFRWLKSWTS